MAGKDNLKRGASDSLGVIIYQTLVIFWLEFFWNNFIETSLLELSFLELNIFWS